MAPPADTAQQRVIRVFISSTFRDMQAEREELVKRVFPQVRRLCEQRGVAWSEVDLRWGVTDEQKAEGAVLPICLAEIDRSRPYFIGLLGQRYGWVPDDGDRSVTELEILHGVLNHRGSADHAFFYLRDPAWVQRQPDPSLYLEETAEGVAKLEDLKTRIRASGQPTREYADPVALGEKVLRDLTALVEERFPADQAPTPLERDRAEHAAYAVSRFTSFVERPALTRRLDEHLAGPLLVTGPSGAGASALVASWAARQPGAVVQHYVGANASSADWKAMAARILGELGVTDVPADGPALRAALAEATRDVLLVVDGVDRLADEHGAPDLLWLPEQTRSVLTSGPGRPLERALNRGWPVLEVPPLDERERREVIATFLGRFAKGLDEVHVRRLVADDLTGNPLFLRTVLDELRQHGDHFTLGELIERLLAAQTVDDLFETVLARYEQDFERDRPGLVRDVFTLLATARRGLTEAELLDLLDVPQATWSPLYLAAEQLLLSRNGLLGFASDHLGTAVSDRYASPQHDRLSAYFQQQPLGQRKVDELPWHQLAAGDAAGAAATLADLSFTELAYRTALADLRRLWAALEAAGHRMADAYQAVVDDPATHDRGQLAWGVARLLTDAGYPTQALALHRYLAEHSEEGPRRTGALLNLGAALWAAGDLEAADRTLQQATTEDPKVRHMVLGNLALVRRDRGLLEEAAALFAEEEQLCRDLGDGFALQASLGNQAQLLRQQGEYDEALAKIAEQEQLCRDNADPAGVARALAARATVLADRGDVAGALALTREYVDGCRETGDLRGLVEGLVNTTTMSSQLGDASGAVASSTEAEAVARRLGDAGLLARVLVTKALAVSATGAWPQAEAIAREGELTARNANAMPQVGLALGIIGTARREQGDLAGCRAAHEEELRVATDPQAVSSAHANLGTAALAENRLADALAEYALAEPGFRERQVHSSLLPVLANRAQIHHQQGDFAAAVVDYGDAAASAATLGLASAVKQWGEPGVQLAYQVGDVARAESLWQSLTSAYRSLGEDASLQRALGERALLLINRQAYDDAVPLLDEQEAICRRIDDQVGLAACVGNRAIVQRFRGDLAGALALVEQQLQLAQASNNGQGVLFATANRGELLGLLGRKDEALQALQWARATAQQWGLQPMVQQLDQLIAQL